MTSRTSFGLPEGGEGGGPSGLSVSRSGTPKGPTSWRQELADLQGQFRSSGLGGEVGWGKSPALIIVDLQRGFTDPACPLGVLQEEVIGSAARLIATARAACVPVTFTVVAYRADLSDAGVWPRKIPAQSFLVAGTEWVELDEGLQRQADERVLVKHQASAFCGTSLHGDLTCRGIDTVIVCGCTTSGCVRATVVDACGLGYRTIVVRDAVGDRHPLLHEVSLFDIEAKYGDVVSEREALDGLARAGIA